MPAVASQLPKRPHRRLLIEFLLARAVETQGADASDVRGSVVGYLVHRFHTDAPSVPRLAAEAREWIADNRPGAAAASFPSGLFVERYALRSYAGAIGTPHRDAIDAARAVSHTINRTRAPLRMAAARAARSNDTPAAIQQHPAPSPGALTSNDV